MDGLTVLLSTVTWLYIVHAFSLLQHGLHYAGFHCTLHVHVDTISNLYKLKFSVTSKNQF